MNELTLEGKIYISSKAAAEITGYAKDYVGQLCREGRIEARLVGRNWYVLKSAIEQHRFGTAPEAQNAALETSNAQYERIATPRYHAQEVELIPSVQRENSEKPYIQESTIETQGEIPGEISTKVEFSMDPSIRSEEESVPIQLISTPETYEIINLAKTRKIDNTYLNQINIPKKEGKKEFYGARIIVAVCLVVILASLVLTYIGIGLGSRYYAHSPLNFIAGVSTYTAVQ